MFTLGVKEWLWKADPSLITWAKGCARAQVLYVQPFLVWFSSKTGAKPLPDTLQICIQLMQDDFQCNLYDLLVFSLKLLGIVSCSSVSITSNLLHQCNGMGGRVVSRHEPMDGNWESFLGRFYSPLVNLKIRLRLSWAIAVNITIIKWVEFKKIIIKPCVF